MPLLSRYSVLQEINRVVALAASAPSFWPFTVRIFFVEDVADKCRTVVCRGCTCSNETGTPENHKHLIPRQPFCYMCIVDDAVDQRSQIITPSDRICSLAARFASASHRRLSASSACPFTHCHRTRCEAKFLSSSC